MAWQSDLVTTLRLMINDFDQPFTYADTRLEQTLVVSAKLVLSVADFSQPFTADISAIDILPDPTIGVNKDDNFTNLFTMRAAALIELGEAKNAAKKGFAFKDETQSFDGKGLAQAYVAIMEKGGWNQAYIEAFEDYQMNAVANIGSAIVGPFRVSAYTIGFLPFGSYPFR